MTNGDDHHELNEQLVQDAFHSYLKSALTQAKMEKLLDADVLSSAESDLMITGPALCLYFAALRSTTNPPSVVLPRSSKLVESIDLSVNNCPPIFSRFLSVWAASVLPIQALSPEHQHDLARVICNLPPLQDPVPAIAGIASDLRAVAIEISQRRSFQDQYASDLQAAIDAGPSTGRANVKASFVPPPVYDVSEPTPSPVSSHARPTAPLPQPPAALNAGPIALHPQSLAAPMPSSHWLSVAPILPPTPSSVQSSSASRSRSNSHSPSSSVRLRTPSPTILTPDSPAIDFIRETLYAALYDVLTAHTSLRSLLHTDPARAYFASVALAILHIARTAITPSGSVRGVLGKELTVDECPNELKPFMLELLALGKLADEVEGEDNEEAMRLVQSGAEVPAPRVERVREMLERGVGYEEAARAEGRRRESVRRSIEGRSVAFSNRINVLTLNLTRLSAFKERQGEVFKVLGGAS